MADSSGQAEIRGINIDKLAKGFADEEIVFKKFVTNSTTSAREIRWYQKTAGYLDSTQTTAITASQIENTDFGSLPVVVEQSWTRQTTYVRKYFVESPTIPEEDIKDCDLDILATNVRDLVRAVERRVDARIWDVMTESRSVVNINSVTTNAAWDTASGTGVDIVEDLLEAKQKIRSYGYDPEGAILFLNSYDHKSLISWLISIKGSSIPQFASAKIESGVVMTLLGLRVVVSENVTTDYACVAVADRAVTWKSFLPITSAVIEDKGIGTKIRVWEEGAAILTDPKAVALISNTKA